ncbi:MAG: divergent polysaccharide deacetylase family protein, partial [Rhizobiales bacterium]|nr:divergent polysaccharide deacetylase family protein [Hyphomicrobiales bacterium]
MTTDDLSTPLGHDTQPHRRRRLPFSGVQVIAAALGLFLLGFAGIALFHQDRLGGEPVVRVALQPDTAAKNPDKDMAAPADAAKPGQPASKAASNPPANGQKTITIIDGSSGARQDVVVASESSATGAETTSAIMSGVDARLL